MQMPWNRQKGPTKPQLAAAEKARMDGVEKALPPLREAAQALEGVPQLPSADKAAPNREDEDLAVLAEEMTDIYTRLKGLGDRLALPPGSSGA